MTQETTSQAGERTQQIAESLSALGFTLTTSAPMAGVEKEWPHIAYNITLSFKGRDVIATSYKLGVGHVKVPAHWEGVLVRVNLTTDEICAFNTLRNKPGAQLKDKQLHASFAAKLAIAQKVAPTLENVLHSLLTDGEAHFNAATFEEWCGDFGYDTDSRSAEAIYTACVEIGRKLARGIPEAVLAQAREIVAEL